MAGTSVYGINHSKSADGTIWDRATIDDTAITSTPGYQVVLGTGDHTTNGDGKQHRYIYASSGGTAVIADAGSQSRLMFSDIASTGVTLTRPNGNNDLVLTVTATGKTVTLRNELYQYYSGLTVNFSDGVIWNQTQIEQMLLDQASAANGGSVYGYSGKDDSIIAGLGDKYLNGYSGNDTYIYTSAGGNDVVDDD